MIKVKTTMKDGRLLIVLGLSDINVQRIKSGEPIYFDMDQLKITDEDRLGGVVVMYGRDEASMTRDLQALIGPETTVISVPKGDERPQ